MDTVPKSKALGVRVKLFTPCKKLTSCVIFKRLQSWMKERKISSWFGRQVGSGQTTTCFPGLKPQAVALPAITVGHFNKDPHQSLTVADVQRIRKKVLEKYMYCSAQTNV